MRSESQQSWTWAAPRSSPWLTLYAPQGWPSRYMRLVSLFLSVISEGGRDELVTFQGVLIAARG